MTKFRFPYASPWTLTRVLLLGLFALGLVVGSSFADDVKKEDVEKKDVVKAKEVAKITLPAAFDKAAAETLDDLKAIQKHIKELLPKITPAVVGVTDGRSSGSGIIITEDGYVLTAGHVSARPDREITLIFPDGKRVKGKTLGQDVGKDSGLIKITEPGKYPFVEMGDSNALKKGQWCICLGHPGGFQAERTPVLRLGRLLQLDGTFLRTDCTLVGGDSGGPLFDMEGKVIGIHSRIGGGIAQNMHVPVSIYRETWDRLVKGESWGGPQTGPSPFIGIHLYDGAKDCKIQYFTEAQTPAEKAGLKVDDVILKFDNKPVSTREELAAQIRSKKPDDEVDVEILRGQEKLTVKVKLGRR